MRLHCCLTCSGFTYDRCIHRSRLHQAAHFAKPLSSLRGVIGGVHPGHRTEVMQCTACRSRRIPSKQWDSCPRYLTDMCMASSMASTPTPGTQPPTRSWHRRCGTPHQHVPGARLPQSCGFRAAWACPRIQGCQWSRLLAALRNRKEWMCC